MKKTFLWLEPSELIQQIYAPALQKHLGSDWEVIFCNTSSEALSYFVEKNIQFFSCSWEIEGDTALQLIKKIRHGYHFSLVPCVLFTSNTNDFFRKCCLKIGVHYYLRKGSIGAEAFAEMCNEIFLQREEYCKQTIEELNISTKPSKTLIYLADDSEINLKVTGKVLQRLGVEVQTATDGLILQELIKQKVPDLVFCDIEMPNCGGLEATQNILKEHPNLQIIGLTGHGDAKMQQTCLDIGMEEAICKPVKKDKLQATLDKYLKP